MRGEESASCWNSFPSTFYTLAGEATFLPGWGHEEGSLGGIIDPRDSTRRDAAATPAREHPWLQPGRDSPCRR